MFKQSKSFIKDYIETNELTYEDKIKDIDLMIEAFVEEERYEDCALLVGIKEDIKEFYENPSTSK